MMRVSYVLGLFLVACSSINPTSAGSLSDPVAVATVPSFSGGKQNPLIFLANTDGQDLRVFVPSTNLFIPGANAISPAAISLEVRDANGNVTLPSFRPLKIAGGAVGTLGYALIAGATNRIAVVDAQTLKSTQAPADVMHCSMAATMAMPDISCLGAAAIDVVAKSEIPDVPAMGPVPAVPAVPAAAFALLAADRSGSQSIATFTPGPEKGVPVLTRAGVPFSLAGAPMAPMPPSFTSFSILLTASETRAFVADRANPRVLDVTLLGGTFKAISTASPVAQVILTPHYIALDKSDKPEGQFALAVLTDGRIQVLDTTTDAVATDTTGLPVAPIEFSSAVQFVTFVPCPVTNGGPPCLTTLRTDASTTKDYAALAFASLADGTTVPLTPDETQPQIFRTVNVGTGAPTIGAPTFLAAGSTVSSSSTTTPTFDPTTLTQGVTRDDSFNLTFKGTLPTLSGRVATLSAGAAGMVTLADPAAKFAPVMASTATATGDTVKLTTIGSDCPQANGLEYTVTAVGTPAGTLTLAPPANPPTCTPAGQASPSRAIYEVHSGNVGPWILVSSSRGQLSFQTGTTPNPMAPLLTRAMNNTQYVVPGRRFYYPGTVTTGQEFTFALSGMDPPDEGSGFTFSTTSGVSAFVVADPTVSAAGSGLATGLAAIPGTLFIAVTGGNALTEAVLANLRLINSVTDFH